MALKKALSGQTYGTLSLNREHDRWLMSDLPPQTAVRLKRVFASIEKTQTRVFHFRNSDELCAEISWFLYRYPMEMVAADRTRLEAGAARYEATNAAVRSIIDPSWKPSFPNELRAPFKPYPNQEKNAALGSMLTQLLIMDEIGLGKSLSALLTLIRAGEDCLPAAIVVQSHLATQWVEKFIKRMTFFSAHIIRSRTPYSLPPADIFIFKYTNIAGWTDYADTGAFRSVVYDEVQELRRGMDASKGRAARVFTDKAKLRLGLSATPVVNLGDEIHTVMEYIAPGALGTRFEFLIQWCTGKVVTDPDALGAYLVEQNLAVRAERSGRPVNTIVVDVEYDESVEAKHEELTRQLAIKVLEGSFAEAGSAARELDMLARRITGLAKARSAAAYVRILLEAGTPVLLAGWHREVYDIWNRELADFKPVMYTGSETTAQKDKNKEAFIRGDTNLMEISLRSGAGLDGLQDRCSTVVVGELDWSGVIHDQLIGRVDRPGQKEDEVTALFMIANGGSDPLVVSLLGLKSSQARGIVSPMQQAKPVYSDISRMKLLAEQFLQKRRPKTRREGISEVKRSARPLRASP